MLVNLTNSSALPTPDILDYVEIGVLAFLVLLGVPLNFLSFIRLIRDQCQRGCHRRWACCLRLFGASNPSRHGPKPISQLRILRVHLLAANLLILCGYGVGEVAWLSTYQFRGGDILCRIMAYIYTFCFYATSNLVAAIGLDRLYVAKRIDRPRSLHERGRWARCIKLSPKLAWIIAAVGATPQLIFWRTFQPDTENWPTWSQCMTVWKVQKYTLGDDSDNLADVIFYERLYEGFHLGLVFWLPAFIIAGSYALILCRFQKSITRVTSNLSSKASVGRSEQRSDARRFPSSFAPDSDANMEESDGPDHLQAPRSQADTTSLNSPNQAQSKTAVVADGPSGTSQIYSFHEHGSSSKAVATLTRAKKRTMKTSAWILLAYVLCWSPYNISSLWCFLYPDSDNKYLELLANLIVLNAVVNPFIYGNS